MAKGRACPNCGKQTLHDQGAFSECSKCATVAWGWNNPVKNVGQGKGMKCPNCDNQTLHKIHELPSGAAIRRCARCDYSAIIPPET